MKKFIRYALMGLIAALGTSVALSALMHALDAIIALGAIGTATYLLWDYLDDEPTYNLLKVAYFLLEAAQAIFMIKFLWRKYNVASWFTVRSRTTVSDI